MDHSLLSTDRNEQEHPAYPQVRAQDALPGRGRHEDIPDVIDFDYNEIVYILSRLTDPACVGIIEVVVSKMQRGKNVTVSQHG